MTTRGPGNASPITRFTSAPFSLHNDPARLTRGVESIDLRAKSLEVHPDAHWTADDQAQGLADGIPESLRSLISRRLAAVPDE